MAAASMSYIFNTLNMDYINDFWFGFEIYPRVLAYEELPGAGHCQAVLH